MASFSSKRANEVTMQYKVNTILSALMLVGFTSLIGCAHAQKQNNSQKSGNRTNYTLNGGHDHQYLGASIQTQSEYDETQPFKPAKHHKVLVDYVEQMALDLIDTLELDTEQSSDINIGVTTIVDLDASLTKSNQLGNQIAETLIHQLQKFGYGVVDFKTANTIDVTRRGDFVFSRNIKKLSDEHMATHVLAGTLIYRNNAVIVNTRVINVKTKKIVASSRELIPFYVINKEDIYLSSN